MTGLKHTISVLGAAALTLSLAACANNTAVPGTTETASSPASVAPAQTPSATASQSAANNSQGAADSTAAALLAIATAEGADGGQAYSIDDEDDDNTWEVDVLVGAEGMEYQISADGSSVVSKNRDDDDDNFDGERAALAAAQVSLAQAITIAVEARGSALDDAELNEGQYDKDDDGDDDDDPWAWEVSLKDNQGDVRVDPATGSILN